MGNTLCCASPEDGVEALKEEKKPKLFGKLNQGSDSEDSEDNPIEERLRDLIPKIRNVK